ncbi:hypothetical protein ACFO0N_14840 [Halobium salinum]|uniref:SPW repeat-containing protein n=1 Tax=Halobium salinum TaxID=1364940 RepID=A0ABD5PE60_9EURY|nr:hypothetical protein [Halobium salinum]
MTEDTAGAESEENDEAVKTTGGRFGNLGWGAKLALGALLAFVLLGAAVQVSIGGAAAVPEALVSVYIVALAAWGVLGDAAGTKRFRIALYAGVLAWGVVNYVAGRQGFVTYALLVLGAVLLTRELAIRD